MTWHLVFPAIAGFLLGRWNKGCSFPAAVIFLVFLLVIALATASGWKMATFRGLIAAGVVEITWLFGFWVFSYSISHRGPNDDASQLGTAYMNFRMSHKPSATAEEFRLALSSVLEMLVPKVLIPGVPVGVLEVPDGSGEWGDHEIQLLIQSVEPDGYVFGWEDHEIDNRERETAVAILKYLEYHECVHQKLNSLRPQREYRSLQKVAIATSEAYRRTLKANAESAWLTGTSYAGERYKRWERAESAQRHWDRVTYERTVRLISELKKSNYGIQVPDGLAFIGDEYHRRLLNSSVY